MSIHTFGWLTDDGAEGVDVTMRTLAAAISFAICYWLYQELMDLDKRPDHTRHWLLWGSLVAIGVIGTIWDAYRQPRVK